jgi:hypothetical protein
MLAEVVEMRLRKVLEDQGLVDGTRGSPARAQRTPEDDW